MLAASPGAAAAAMDAMRGVRTGGGGTSAAHPEADGSVSNGHGRNGGLHC